MKGLTLKYNVTDMELPSQMIGWTVDKPEFFYNLQLSQPRLAQELIEVLHVDIANQSPTPIFQQSP